MVPVIEALAETTISNLVGAVTSLMKEKVDVILNAEEDLKILQRKLEDIRMPIQDADRKPFFISEHVRDWEGELKDILYDAEDIIEKCRTTIELDQRKKRSTWRNKVLIMPCITLHSCFKKHVSTPYQLGNEIQKINRRLDEIDKHTGIMDLPKRIPKARDEGPDIDECDNPRETTDRVGAQPPIDMEDDKNKIIEKLLCDGSTKSSTPLEKDAGLSIISIIGQAGSGKTTLAKMVFNEVEEHFEERRWWVCVSEEPNLKDLLQKILKQVFKESENLEDITSLSYLCMRLKSELSKKRFLLVLDDIWEIGWWFGVIEGVLMGGAMGSKILVICRNENVLLGMNASYMHKLPELITFRKSWDLFLKKALREGQTEQDLVIHDIRDVGERIVKQCCGLPFVVETVGSMMQTKSMRRDVWEVIANSGIWKWRIPTSSSNGHGDIFPGLILCYNDLSPHLRSCFVYFSIYPKGYAIERDELVMQWVARGLVEESYDIDVEDSANVLLDDLISRGLIEVTEWEQLKMHDTVHDFARYIAGKEYTHALTTDNTRHLSLVNVQDSDVVVCNVSRAANNKLRTLLIDTSSLIDYHSINMANVTSLKWLRVLSFKRHEINELPNSIGDLVLLKYLDLSSTGVRNLPSSIGELYNLQTLNLGLTCIEELPKEMEKLCNLRYLGLKCYFLTFVPEGLGKLTHLSTLNTFLVCDDRKKTKGCNIRELKGLNKLKGQLSIKGLGGTRTADDAEKTTQLLVEKHGLISLELDFGVQEDDKVAGASKQSSVLGVLEPPHCLKELKIRHYKGQMPAWFLEPNYATLQTLELDNCPLWSETMGTVSLETPDIRALMPSLKLLTIRKSNGLKMPRHMPALEELNVNECGSLEQVAADMSALKKLWLYEVNTLKELPACLPSLEELMIGDLPDWEGWPAAGMGKTTISSMPCLRNVDFCNCPKLQTQGLIFALCVHGCRIQLQRLKVLDCPSARLGWELLKQLPNLSHLELDGSALESTQPSPLLCEVSTFLPSLRSLTLWDDNNDLEWGRVPEWVWGLSQLEELELRHFSKEINLGGHWQCLRKLRCLRLSYFPILKSLVDISDIPLQNDGAAGAGAATTTYATDANEQIACLSMLDLLHVWDCPELELPEELGKGLGPMRLQVPFVD